MQTKTRYSEAELEEFRLLIMEKMDKANEQLTLYQRQLAEIGKSGDAKLRGLDDSSGTVEVERLSTLAARQHKLIQHLEYALMRIQNKVYGVCRETKQLISKERLRAVPHTTLSIKAKQRR